MITTHSSIRHTKTHLMIDVLEYTKKCQAGKKNQGTDNGVFISIPPLWCHLHRMCAYLFVLVITSYLPTRKSILLAGMTRKAKEGMTRKAKEVLTKNPRENFTAQQNHLVKLLMDKHSSRLIALTVCVAPDRKAHRQHTPGCGTTHPSTVNSTL